MASSASEMELGSQSDGEELFSDGETEPVVSVRKKQQKITHGNGIATHGRKGARDSVGIPFSPRHGETNRLQVSPAERSQKTVKSIGRNQRVSPPKSQVRPGTRQLVQSSQEAVKKLTRLGEATKNINKMHSRKLRGNASGVIKSIKLYNFMCHKSFYQEWHENLNFVIGENGSGKSALLSGLMIGLGGKALSTARTSSVKDLIKTGATHAKTEVVLLNKGKLPLDTYGDQITVQRIINSNGQSTYKLQYGNEYKFKPATKVELDNILRTLDIQLENPVVILNQEYARSFLRTKDPKDKYKLFEDGVGTGECDRIRFQVQETLNDIDATLVKKQEELDALAKTYKDCENKVKLVDGIAAQHASMKKLEVELKWYYVQVEEQKESELHLELSKIMASLEKNKTHYKNSMDQKNELLSTNRPSDNAKAELTNKKHELERCLVKIREDMNALNRERVKAEMKVKTVKNALPKKQKTASALGDKINNTEKKMHDDRERLLQKYQEEKDRLSTEIREIEQQIEMIEEEKTQFSESCQRLRRQIEQTKSQREAIKSQIVGKEKSIKQLQSSSSNLFAYGPQMRNLVDRIDACRNRFSKPPRGPLGACITVKDSKYLSIIQFILRNVLFDFTVDNGKDLKVMTNIINEVYGSNYDGRRPSIHVIKFHAAYDHSRTNCSKDIDYPTVLDMLEFDNNDHIIMNTLLEVSTIERILLFKDTKEALNILGSRNTAPKFCKMGFTLDFFKITPDPHLRCDAQNQPRNQQPFVKTSVKAQIQTMQLELVTLQDELKNYVVDQEPIDEEKRLRTQEKKCDDHRLAKRRELTSLQQKLHNLKAPPDRMADLTSLRDELQEVTGEIERLQEDLERFQRELDGKNDAIREKDDLRTSVEEDVRKTQGELNKFLEESSGLEDRVRAIEVFAARFVRAMDKNKDEAKQMNARIASAKEKVREVTEDASTLGERVPVTRGSAEIKREHDEIKERLQHLARYADRRESIRERYEAVKKRYSKYKTDMRMVAKMFQKVKKYFTKVNLHYLVARDRVTTALVHCYEEVARARKYYGKIIIDHNSKELFYLICPDREALEKISTDPSDPKFKSKMVEYAAGLSGGERSFSTICFIIAMWQAMKSPFYMLDEFDVFMDAQNRTVSQEALMTHAKNFPANQFFFFTPLDLTAIPSKSEALILRLYPPERNGNSTNDATLIDSETPSTSSRKRGRGDNVDAGPSKTMRR